MFEKRLRTRQISFENTKIPGVKAIESFLETGYRKILQLDEKLQEAECKVLVPCDVRMFLAVRGYRTRHEAHFVYHQ